MSGFPLLACGVTRTKPQCCMCPSQIYAQRTTTRRCFMLTASVFTCHQAAAALDSFGRLEEEEGSKRDGPNAHQVKEHVHLETQNGAA